MKQFFLQVNCYIPKNRAHDAAQSFARQYDKCLMDEPLLFELIKDMEKKVNNINLENKRCQDINLHHRVTHHGTIELSIESNFYFSISEVKRYELIAKSGRDPIFDLYGDMKAH